MKHILTKEIKKDGNSKCIRFNRLDIKRFKLEEGKLIDFEVKKVYEYDAPRDIEDAEKEQPC